MADVPLPSNLCRIYSTATANPAAGSEVSITVPAGKWWVVMSASVTLAQGLTQTPNPTLVFDDGTNILFQSPSLTSAINASVTAQVSWAPGNNPSAGGALTAVCSSIPADAVLGAGYRIRTVTAGIGANTDYGAMQLLVAELG